MSLYKLNVFYQHYSQYSRPKWTMARHVGPQPLTKDSRSNPPAKGVEPLTKDSRSNPLTNCTILRPQGEYGGEV
jgi:hypothetical protein